MFRTKDVYADHPNLACQDRLEILYLSIHRNSQRVFFVSNLTGSKVFKQTPIERHEIILSQKASRKHPSIDNKSTRQ